MSSSAQAADTVREFTHTIDGKAEGSAKSFGVINPSTAAEFAQCPDASKDQLDRAVASARRAFKTWSKLSYEERANYLRKLGAAVKERADEFAALITREQGKPFAHSQREMIGTVTWFDNISKVKIEDQVMRDDGKNRIMMYFRPIGVVGGITPWNVPVGLASHKIAQALYVGNTLVLKPSPYTPLSTLLLGEISRGILPPGVFNVVSGGNDLGQWLTEHPDINKITFTGSVATGKRVMGSASGTLKRVTLELGGNDPAIVLDDVDLAETSAKIFNGAFANCGQICMAVKRVYVPEKLYEPMVESFAELARNFRVGDGFEADVQMGPLQNKMQFDKVLDVLEDTKRQPGVRIVAGGHTLNRPGYYLAPTIVADIKDDARLVKEEQFGPVLPILKYKSVDDAIARANDTTMGLGASVWTNDLERGAEVAGQIEAGTVWVNHHIGAEIEVPFGGFKESGLGREHGVMGLHAYMEAQVINVPVKQ